MQWDPDCPFTKEERAELEKLANSPLDYEVRTLQEQDEHGGYMLKSGRKEFEAKMKELGLAIDPDITGNSKVKNTLNDLLTDW